MSTNPFNWSIITGVADETFGIPPDVTFQIVEDGHLHEIKAHKMILSMVSHTFKIMFYTSEVGDKTAKEVEIKETTAPAFQILIDAIYYTRSIEDSLKGKSAKEIFDVINLIEQYEIIQLKETVKAILSAYPVTEDTVMEVAAEAMEYAHLFDKEVQDLLLACAKFLRPQLKNMYSIFTYAAENSDNREVFSALLALMKDIAPIVDTTKNCSNCGYETCQNGHPVKESQLRVGLIVNNDLAVSKYWSNSDWGTGEVTRVEPETIHVTTVKGAAGHRLNGRYHKASAGKPLFLFYCENM